MARLTLRRHTFYLRNFERRTGERRHFARDAKEREAIGAVRRELQHEHVIVEPERRARVAPDLAFQLEQAGVIVGQAELARRAEHALALHAAQRGALHFEVW